MHRLELIEDNMSIVVSNSSEHLFVIQHNDKDVTGAVDEEISVIHNNVFKIFKLHEIEKAKKLFLKLMSDFNWAKFRDF